MSPKLLLVALALALPACGLTPVYSGGSSGPAARTLAQVEIAPIPDRAGFLVRQALLDGFGAAAAPQRYRLEVELDDQIVAFGVRGDNSAARERRTLRARYRLIDVASNAVLLDASAGSDAGIDRVSSNYAGAAAAPQRYRLEVELDDQIVAFGVRGDNSAARERRTLRARYRLIDVASNAVLLDASAGSDAGIDRVSSNYAVVAAENTALERLAIDIARQITARLAQYARTAPPA